jgi:hypothetical protein
MKTWMKGILFFLFVLILAVMDSQAQAPTLTSVYPNYSVSNQPMTVTIEGKGFKKGMTFVYDGYKYFGVPTKIINQYKATAVITLEHVDVAYVHLSYNGDLSNTLRFKVVDPMKITACTPGNSSSTCILNGTPQP